MDLEKLKCGYPSPRQLEKINGFRPVGMEPYAAEELITIPILASTNLISYTYSQWGDKALQNMVRSYQRGGQDLMLDHEWDDVDECAGIIYDAEMVYTQNPSILSLEYLLAKSPNPEVDRSIISEQGVKMVVCYAAIEATSEMAGHLRYLRRGDVSVGGDGAEDYYCPLCSKEYGEMVSFRDERCPHLAPSPMFFAYEYQYLDGNSRKMVAPYKIREGIDNMYELSCVMQGNCPQASVFRENMKGLVLS